MVSGTTVSILYASSQLLLLLMLAIHTYRAEKKSGGKVSLQKFVMGLCVRVGVRNVAGHGFEHTNIRL